MSQILYLIQFRYLNEYKCFLPLVFNQDDETTKEAVERYIELLKEQVDIEFIGFVYAFDIEGYFKNFKPNLINSHIKTLKIIPTFNLSDKAPYEKESNNLYHLNSLRQDLKVKVFTNKFYEDIDDLELPVLIEKGD